VKKSSATQLLEMILVGRDAFKIRSEFEVYGLRKSTTAGDVEDCQYFHLFPLATKPV
jgi:hypothetical protein